MKYVIKISRSDLVRRFKEYHDFSPDFNEVKVMINEVKSLLDDCALDHIVHNAINWEEE